MARKNHYVPLKSSPTAPCALLQLLMHARVSSTVGADAGLDSARLQEQYIQYFYFLSDLLRMGSPWVSSRILSEEEMIDKIRTSSGA